VGLKRRLPKRTSRYLGALLLSLVLAFMTLSVAFGDNIPEYDNSKTLGVGRIQNTLPGKPVAVGDKFSFAPTVPETSLAQTPELAPLNSVPGTLAQPTTYRGSGWKTTMATNYGTPADGFLDEWTAMGTITSETSMGVAHKSLPLGTVIEIYCPQSGLSCIATVDDRGPYGGYWGTQPDTFDFQMGTTAALGNNYGWYVVMYRIIYSPY